VTTLQAEIELQIESGASDRMGDVPLMSEHLIDLLQFSLESEDVVGDWAIVVVLTSDEHLRALHNQFMGIDEPTDVMTFPYDQDGKTSTHGGDIVISIDHVIDHAEDFGLSRAQEVEFLAVHGTLHLCGWEDTDPLDRERMLTRQRAIIAAFEARHL
jgi:probable rRNA maturation factor